MVVQGIVEYAVEDFLFQLLNHPTMAGEQTELVVRLAEDGRFWFPFSTTEGGDGSVEALPEGPWAVTVVNAAGQTWMVPNEFGAAEANPTGGFEPESQRAMVMLQ